MKAPERQWIVEGLIPNGLSILAGHPKMGKSRLALQLAMTLSSGERFLGRKVARGESIYFALDDDIQTLKERVLAMSGAMKLGDDIEFMMECPPLDMGGHELIVDRIKKNSGLRLVVIDVWQKIRCQKFPPGLNAYERDYAEAYSLKSIANEHNVAVIMVHHLRKSGHGPEQDDVLERLSGSMGLAAAADGIFVFERKRNEPEAKLHASGKAIPDMQIMMRNSPGDLTWKVDGQREPQQNERVSKKMMSILESLAAHGQMTLAEIAKDIDSSIHSAGMTLKLMLERGLVKKPRWGVYESC